MSEGNIQWSSQLWQWGHSDQDRKDLRHQPRQTRKGNQRQFKKDTVLVSWLGFCSSHSAMDTSTSSISFSSKVQLISPFNHPLVFSCFCGFTVPLILCAAKFSFSRSLGSWILYIANLRLTWTDLKPSPHPGNQSFGLLGTSVWACDRKQIYVPTV